MRHLSVLLALVAGAAAAEPAQTPQEEFARLTRGTVPGKPVTCVNLPRTSDSRTIYGLGIVYRIGGTYYLNRLGGDCPLSRFDILVTDIPSTQLCRGDTARIVQTGSQVPRGTCIYGDFETYRRAR